MTVHTPTAMSYSRYSKFTTCPKAYYFRYIKKMKDVGGLAAVRGSYIHEVLEDLYRLDPVERTRDNAKRFAADRWSEYAEKSESAHNHDLSKKLVADEWSVAKYKQDVWKGVTDIWAVEDPEKVVVTEVEEKCEVSIAGVPMLGYIDRTEPGTVVDYKTGKPWKTHRDQIALYSAMKNSLGGDFPGGSVIYVGRVRKKDDFVVTDKMRSKVVNGVCNAYEDIVSKDADDSGDWPAVKNNLCDKYCSFKAVCPLFNNL